MHFSLYLLTLYAAAAAAAADDDDDDRLTGDETPQKLVATPVRRSTRRSCAALPVGLRDHDVIVESVEEIVPDVGSRLLFRDNRALQLEWQTDAEASIKCLVHAADSH